MGSKKPYHGFENINLYRAVEAVKEGMTFRNAEINFGVPKSTIHRKVKNLQQKKYGKQPVFSEIEEKELSERIGLSAEWGFLPTGFDIRCIVKKYMGERGITIPRFKNNRPGIGWVKSYLKRQSVYLKYRIYQNIKRARAAMSSKMINLYFEELSISLKNVPNEAILNYDETSMQDDPGNSTVIVRRTCKYPERIVDFSKSNYSVMFSGTASGVVLPPYVVFKADNMYDSWTEGGPPGACYNHSKSGWFESNIFEDWFLSIAVPYFKKLGDCHKAIIGDNLTSHLSVNVLKICSENNIRFILLPPNSTHLGRPLDLAFFSPLKTVWRSLLTDWKMKYKGTIRKDQFPRLLKNTLDELGQNVSENIIAGFKKSGIAPLDKNKVLNLPQEVGTPGNISGESWTSIVKEYLKETRKNQTKVNPRKKKINVTPCKSLTDGNVMNVMYKLALKELENRRGDQKLANQNDEKKKVVNKSTKDDEKKRRVVDKNTKIVEKKRRIVDSNTTKSKKKYRVSNVDKYLYSVLKLKLQ